MKTKILVLAGLAALAAVLWLPGPPAGAQQPQAATVEPEAPGEIEICFYRNGDPAGVSRPGALSGAPQLDAQLLLEALLAGPNSQERDSGLTSGLPPGSELSAVTVEDDGVTVDLRLPPEFLQYELDAYRSDAIVEQIIKTLYPLDLNHFAVRAENERGEFVPLSDFLPVVAVPAPETPPNADTIPEEPAGENADLEHAGQPPTVGPGQPAGALSGKTVWLSAGHGWYWNSSLNSWRTQRGNYNGLVEDFSNAEAVNYYLARYLWNAGADVQLVRERGMNPYEIIVDNDQGAPAYVETGSWLTGSTTGYNGGTYRYDTSTTTPLSTATWTPELPAAGSYPVWAWYRHGDNRTTDARYEIHHAGGVTSVSLSQEVHGQTWRYLGEYYFQAGTAGHVTLLCESSDPGQAVIADAVRFGSGPGSFAEPGGASGEPRWEEAAKYWARYQGAPPEVYENDVVARPRYAEWESAKGYPGEAENAVYISWHTNGYNGEIVGTESYIHSTEPTTGSVELQDFVHAELIADIRAAWDPAWTNRGQKSADFGELRDLEIIPGVLLEVAFHDSADANALLEPTFRQLAARAVYQGIVKYHAQRQGTAVQLLPEPPQRLAARNSGLGEVTLQWAPPPCCNGVVGDAATGYRVYHSKDGRGFGNAIETTEPGLVFTGLESRSLHFFRVTATNKGGESFPSAVVAVRTPGPGGSPPALIVDGSDRLDRGAMVPQWESSALGTAQRMFLERMNRFDYAVEHGAALASCGLAFDGAVNEAIESGDLSLADYQLVDWFTGEDAEADASLSTTERVLLASYLQAGGRLLISGAEIGWDLVGRGRDPAFYSNYLQASYQGDDAGTYTFAGVPGSLFDGLAGRFDDSTLGTYDVDYPDLLAATVQSNVVLNYTGGSATATGAAVAYRGDFGLVYFGFPVETVTDAKTRSDLICAAASYLLPGTGPAVAFFPDHSATAYTGQVMTYSHTLSNLGAGRDTFDLAHSTSQGWVVTYTTPITLEAQTAVDLPVQIFVPADAPSGTLDITVITATSRTDPAVVATVHDTTTAVREPPPPLIGTSRIINPGFEGARQQTAWLATSSSGDAVFVPRAELPAGVEPYNGDWLAWLGAFRPATPVTATLTQTVALPSGEPTVTLSLAWTAQSDTPDPSASDTFSVAVYDISGTVQASLLTVQGETPVRLVGRSVWQTAAFDLSAFAGQTIQIAFRTTTQDTAYFVDDVQIVSQGHQGPDEFRALWVDAYHDGIKNRRQIDELVETARAGSINALVVQVRRRADTYYPSNLDPWAPDADPSFDALAYLIDRAHAAGIQVHAWATTLAIWGGDTPPAAANHVFHAHGPGAMGRDYWLMTRENGEEKASDVYYLDPGHPDAVAYTVAAYAELAANYALDGLHLDRVRYAWQDWGYNPTALARFQTQTGRTDRPAPDDAQWLQWRRDQLTALVRKIYLTVAAIDPGLRLSAALSAVGYPPNESYPWETRNPYTHHLQDWRSWLEEGILDLGVPMTYRDHDELAGQFVNWATWQKDHQYGRGVVVGTGLYLNSVEDSMTQWLLARQPTALGHQPLGVCGYSYATPSSEGALKRDVMNAAVTTLFTQTASIPALPWKASPANGHLLGALSQRPACQELDGIHLQLSGPQVRTLTADANGWFGAVDLPPGDYMLTVGIISPTVTIQAPVAVVAGVVTREDLNLPSCRPFQIVYLPLITKNR